jgi:hypothetical protein
VNLKVTLLFTYSGIADKRIEPYPSQVAVDSLKLISGPGHRRYRTILYWRPLVAGLNDSNEHLARAYALSRLIRLLFGGSRSYSRNGMSIFVLLLYSGYAWGKVAVRFRSSTVPL